MWPLRQNSKVLFLKYQMSPLVRRFTLENEILQQPN